MDPSLTISTLLIFCLSLFVASAQQFNLRDVIGQQKPQQPHTVLSKQELVELARNIHKPLAERVKEMNTQNFHRPLATLARDINIHRPLSSQLIQTSDLKIQDRDNKLGQGMQKLGHHQEEGQQEKKLGYHEFEDTFIDFYNTTADNTTDDMGSGSENNTSTIEPDTMTTEQLPNNPDNSLTTVDIIIIVVTAGFAAAIFIGAVVYGCMKKQRTQNDALTKKAPLSEIGGQDNWAYQQENEHRM